MYQLVKHEISDLILLDTKKINGTWLACFKKPKSQFLTAKKQFMGSEHSLINKVNKKGVELNTPFSVNEPDGTPLGTWISLDYFIPIAKNNSEKNKCDWTKNNLNHFNSP